LLILYFAPFTAHIN